MDATLIERLEQLTLTAGGEYGLNHSRRLQKLIAAIAETDEYHHDVLTFCTYTHDLGAFATYAQTGVDHALRSRDVALTLAHEYGFGEQALQDIIAETIEKHHAPIPGKSYESILLRDADVLDYLGYIGIARDFSRNAKNLKEAFLSVKKRYSGLPQKLILESSKRLAVSRIAEMEQFMRAFVEESFDLY